MLVSADDDCARLEVYLCIDYSVKKLNVRQEKAINIASTHLHVEFGEFFRDAVCILRGKSHLTLFTKTLE